MDQVMWFRVFAKSDAQPDRAALLDAARAVAADLHAGFEEDARGWLRAEFELPGVDAPIHLDQFWRDEEGVRQELQAWAAWLETCEDSEHAQPLMQHMISTEQVFTLRRPETGAETKVLDEVCHAICRFLASVTDGVYQADDQGFFSAEGSLLLRE